LTTLRSVVLARFTKGFRKLHFVWKSDFLQAANALPLAILGGNESKIPIKTSGIKPGYSSLRSQCSWSTR